MLIRASRGTLLETLRVFRRCGRGECECVVYWEGPAGTASVDATVHPTHSRSPFGYEVSGTWLAAHGSRLARQRRSVLAQVHTHPGEAFHSETDDQWPLVAQAGFVSLVLPGFALACDFSAAAAFELDGSGIWVGRELSALLEIVE